MSPHSVPLASLCGTPIRSAIVQVTKRQPVEPDQGPQPLPPDDKPPQ